jgi:hypothetical protein
MAVTHDIAHSFDVVDALPVKTDEGGESHRARTLEPCLRVVLDGLRA